MNRQDLFWVSVLGLGIVMATVWFVVGMSGMRDRPPQPHARFSSFTFQLGGEDEPYPPPRILCGFLTQEERQWLIDESGRQGFTTSLVGGDTENLAFRRSETCWLNPDDHPRLRAIYDRVLALPELRALPNCVLESCQIVRYRPNGYFHAHYDQCCEDTPYCKEEIRRFGAPRGLTLIFYLNDDFKGGETQFANLYQTVCGRAGDAVLFHSLTADGRRVHPASLHQGLPVIEGEKWIANVWVRYEL